MAGSSDAPRAYDVTRDGDVLTVTIRRAFDFGNLSQDWAHFLAQQWPGPYREVRIDLANCGLVSSTFFAGLIQLHHAYAAKGGQPLLLVRPDPRLVRNLIMLRLDKMFRVEPR
jgi:anti-anti-sigma regulatory factor